LRNFISEISKLYAEYTPEFAEKESGVPAATIIEVARRSDVREPVLMSQLAKRRCGKSWRLGRRTLSALS
jgi:anaerobic selenocysteine-containing dehydrogenase